MRRFRISIQKGRRRYYVDDKEVSLEDFDKKGKREAKRKKRQ